MIIKVRQVFITILIGLAVVVVISVFTAVAASNTVSGSRAGQDQSSITGNDLKPAECAGINITNIVDIGAGESGTPGNDLILGTAGVDTVIRGGAGDDCILGGGGNDRRRFFIFWIPGLFGDEGDDVLIGGPGQDACYGGAGNDTYYGCETEW